MGTFSAFCDSSAIFVEKRGTSAKNNPSRRGVIKDLQCVVIKGDYLVAFTTAVKAAGSLTASSDRTLRSRSMFFAFRAAMNRP